MNLNEANNSYFSTITSTIYNNTSSCLIPKTFGTYEEFFECYKFFVSLNVTKSVMEILLSVLTSLANTLVIVCLVFKPKMNIFDQIIIGHSKLVLKLIYQINITVFYPISRCSWRIDGRCRHTILSHKRLIF